MTINEKELKIQKMMVQSLRLAKKSWEEADLPGICTDLVRGEEHIALSILAAKIFDQLVKLDQLAK